jgi:cation:H+ antiporter
MMIDLILFAAGCICAAFGGELFVQGLVGLADWGRLPRGVVAATIGAFATSSPELIVGITAATEGVPEISLGDALGSSIVNVALILAIPIMLFGLSATRDSVFRDLPFALAIFPIIALAGRDGTISPNEALMLLAVFAVWVASVVVFALRNRTDGQGGQGGSGVGMLLATGGGGLVMLFLAGQLIVTGASGLAAAAGLPAFFIGATVVALGTSVPELATVIIAAARGHREVGLQTILGSNIFNCLFVVSVATLIHQIPVDWGTASLALSVGFAVTLLTLPVFSLQIGRWRGFVLVTCYVAFIALSVGSIH